MMTPKMKEDFCTQILGASRQLFLSGRISEICREKGTQKQLEFILELLQAELTLRDENRRKRLIKRAGFPTYKTFEGYSYHCVKFPPAFSREELETLEFVPGKKNLVLYGPVGIGKTHMAIAAGVKACNLGYKTKFYTVTELVLKLAESRKNGTLERLLRDLRSLDLLILDEWGYVPVDKDGSQLLFRVISDSYESKSLILTTNLEFSKWGGIFTDDQMAAAMIDRLVHHGHLLIFEGKSIPNGARPHAQGCIMPAEGRENPLLKKGNSDAFFREKYLTKNRVCGSSHTAARCRLHPAGSSRRLG